MCAKRASSSVWFYGLLIQYSFLSLQGLTFFLGYSIFSAVLGMLQFGYNTGVINAPESVSAMTNQEHSSIQ